MPIKKSKLNVIAEKLSNNQKVLKFIQDNLPHGYYVKMHSGGRSDAFVFSTQKDGRSDINITWSANGYVNFSDTATNTYRTLREGKKLFWPQRADTDATEVFLEGLKIVIPLLEKRLPVTKDQKDAAKKDRDDQKQKADDFQVNKKAVEEYITQAFSILHDKLQEMLAVDAPAQAKVKSAVDAARKTLNTKLEELAK